MAQTASKELDIVGQRFSCLTSVTSSAQLQVSDEQEFGELCASFRAVIRLEQGLHRFCQTWKLRQAEQINISFHQKPSEVNQKLKIPTSEIFGCKILENDIPSPWCQMPGRETGPRAG